MKRCTLILVMMLLFLFPMTVSATQMKIHVINLQLGNGDTQEYGDAVLLQSGKENILMDTGSVEASKSVVSYLKKAGVKRLSLFISHFHKDHIGGVVSILKDRSFVVERVYVPDPSCFSKSNQMKTVSSNYVNYIKKKSIPVTYLKKGSSFKVGDMVFRIFGPCGTGKSIRIADISKYENDSSLCTMVTCGTIRYLSTGNISMNAERRLLKLYKKRELRADIMKLSHHGGTDSTSKEWVKAINPRYVFASHCSAYKKVKQRFKKKTDYRVTGKDKCSYLYSVDNTIISVCKVR